MTRKLVLNDGRTERELLLAGTLVIGRDPSCDISDLDPLLSRRHAEFVSNAQGLVVRDLGSRNGILVNGVKVPERKLASGDIVQLGHLHLRYVEDVTPPAPGAVRQAEETTATALESATMLPSSMRQVVPDTRRPPGAPSDLDATFAPGSGRAAAPTDLDATFAPGSARPAALDLAATMAPSGPRVPVAAGGVDAASPEDDTQVPHLPADVARIVVNTSLIVTSSTAACEALLGVRPDTLVGSPVTDALMLALRALASGDRSSPLTIVAERSASGGTIAITLKAG